MSMRRSMYTGSMTCAQIRLVMGPHRGAHPVEGALCAFSASLSYHAHGPSMCPCAQILCLDDLGGGLMVGI